MKITLLWVGKTKNRHLLAMIEEYLGRVRHFVDLSCIETKPNPSHSELECISKEGQALLRKLTPDDYVVALDSSGEHLSSEQFSRLLSDRRDQSSKNLVFVLGGHFGLSDKVKSRANYILCLSRMTLTHEIARLFLVEQIYRAFALIHHLPYHK